MGGAKVVATPGTGVKVVCKLGFGTAVGLGVGVAKGFGVDAVGSQNTFLQQKSLESGTSVHWLGITGYVEHLY